MDNLDEGKWYAGDHIDGGFEALEKLGRPREDIRLASAGYSDSGDPQVLMMGWSHLEILKRDGHLILEVGDREIRGLRLVEGAGVQVCTTPGGGSVLRQTKWMHRVSDDAARYLEQSWVDSYPVMHEGTQLNSLPWREEEYAYYAGRVITEGARCDAALVELVFSARKLLGRELDETIYGASGEPLAEEIQVLGEQSEAFADVGVRYREWYKQRNFVVHGYRGLDASGRPTSQIFKPKKGKKGQVLDVEILDHDFQTLALIWRAFYALSHDAFQAAVYLGGEGTPEEVLARIPLPSTVSESERLPSGHIRA